MLSDAKRRVENDGTVEPWDVPFYVGLLKARDGFDINAVSQYLTLDHCLGSMTSLVRVRVMVLLLLSRTSSQATKAHFQALTHLFFHCFRTGPLRDRNARRAHDARREVGDDGRPHPTGPAVRLQQSRKGQIIGDDVPGPAPPSREVQSRGPLHCPVRLRNQWTIWRQRRTTGGIPIACHRSRVQPFVEFLLKAVDAFRSRNAVSRGTCQNHSISSKKPCSYHYFLCNLLVWARTPFAAEPHRVPAHVGDAGADGLRRDAVPSHGEFRLGC